MELSKEAQKVAFQNMKGNLLDMAKNLPIKEDIINTLLSTFKQIVEIGDTEYLQLFAAMCIESLDLEMYHLLEVAYLGPIRTDVYFNNTVTYKTMNALDTE